jgi:cell division protein FtsW
VDVPSATAVALLAGIGLVSVYSATAPLAIGDPLPPHFLRHLAALCAGLVCVAIGRHVPIGAWRRLAMPLWALGVVLLALTLVMGTEAHGARRWLSVPGLPLSLQAAEFAKWATLMALAAELAPTAGDGAPTRRALGRCIGLLSAPAALLLLQPDFGSTAVLIALCGMLLFVAGIPVSRLAAPAVAALVGAAGYVALAPYARARWIGFLDPWSTARDQGFQLVQSFVAFGRGGAFGVGLGDGRQKLFYLPEAHTDFILSVVAEEMGLVGVLVVLAAFAVLLVAGTRIARRARDRFTALAAFAMTGFLVVPAIVNAAVVMGLLPTTGFVLPFLSFGANALVVCALAFGILLRIGAVEAAPQRRRIGSASPRGLVGT